MVIYGKQLFLHIIKNYKKSVKTVYLAKECDKALFSQIVGVGAPIKRVDNQKAQALARGGNHQGFLAEVEEFEFKSIDEIKKQNFIAVLYGLSDVGNIGAIVRTAHALGCGGIVVVAKNLAMEGILRASSGAAYEANIALVEDGLSLLNELKQVGFKIYATASELAKKLQEANLSGEWCVVVQKNPNFSPEKITQNDILELEISPKAKAKLLAKITGRNAKEIYSELTH